MKRVLVVFLVLVVGLSIGLFIKVRQNTQALFGPTRGSGVIEGLEAGVGARFAARILEVRAMEGDEVEKGQPLVLLDCREQNALLAAARARMESAEKGAAAAKAQVQAALGTARAAEVNVDASDAQRLALSETREVTSRQAERITKLQGEGGATAMELDRATTQVRELGEQLRALDARTSAAKGQAAAANAQADAAREQAEAALAAIGAARADVERAQALVDECTLVAPISGVIETRAFEPGEVALPGTRLLTIVSIADVEATFFVPNRELGVAVVGREITASADTYDAETFRGRIIAVSPKAEFTPRNVQTREDRDRLVYAVKVRFANEGKKLRPGMPVEVTIPGTERPESGARP